MTEIVIKAFILEAFDIESAKDCIYKSQRRIELGDLKLRSSSASVI
jgi:hypothetical protein